MRILAHLVTVQGRFLSELRPTWSDLVLACNRHITRNCLHTFNQNLFDSPGLRGYGVVVFEFDDVSIMDKSNHAESFPVEPPSDDLAAI